MLFKRPAEEKDLFDALCRSVEDKSYVELRDRFLEHEESQDMVSPSGKRYSAEVLAYWDDKPDGALRVFVTLTPDSRWRLFGGMSYDFMKPAE